MDRFVCMPCAKVIDPDNDNRNDICTRGASTVVNNILAAQNEAISMWRSGLYDMVLVFEVDELDNVSLRGTVCYRSVSSRYDLPLSVKENEKTLPRLVKIAREYATRDMPIVEDD